MSALFLLSGSVDFERDIFDVDQNLVNGDVIVRPYLQLPFQGFNQYFIHFLVFAMKLNSLVVDPVQNVLQIGNFRDVM